MKKKRVLSVCAICLLFMLALPTMASATPVVGDGLGASQSIAPKITQHRWDSLCCVGAACADNEFECSGCYAYQDEDGDGVCDNALSSTACPGFVDNDGDGVCDNRERSQNAQKSGLARGCRHGPGQGRGCGRLN